MEPKTLVALLLTINVYSSCAASLRRTPKVYNALITTDENLTSSRAYPVIQPSIHETGIASYPYGPYNPFGLYSNSLVRFGQPLVPGLSPREQPHYPFQHPGLQPQLFQPHQPQLQNPFLPQQPELPPSGPGAELPTGPGVEPQSQNEVIPPPSAPGQEPIPMPMQPPQPPQQMQPNEKLPLPLNQYGLPPSLVPLQPYPQQNRQPLPINLQPYPYQNFPVLYEPYNGFRDHYLPPYDYFPSHTYGIAAPPPRQSNPSTPSPKIPTPPTDQQPEPTSPAPTPAAPMKVQLPTDVPLASIKNGSANKDVPDVPPPPIPSGGKSTNEA